MVTIAVLSLVRVSVMPFGDSITYGWPHGSYRTELKRELPNIRLVGSCGPCEAHPGFTLLQLAKGAPKWFRTYRPDVALIQGGSNDMTHQVSPRVSASALERIIRAALDAGVKRVYVAGPTPYYRAMWAVEKYDSALKPVAESFGPRVTWVGTIPLSRTEFYDNLHPSKEGYDHMGRFWAARIRPCLQRGI